MERPIRENYVEMCEAYNGELYGALNEDDYIDALESYIDYLESIKNLPNELKGVSNNEQKEKFCSYCGKRKTLKGNGTIEKLCEC